MKRWPIPLIAVAASLLAWKAAPPGKAENIDIANGQVDPSESWSCRLAWHFPAGDKEYRGKGPNEALARGAAVQNCVASQGGGSSNLSYYCYTTPHVNLCSPVGQPAPPIPPEPTRPEIFGCAGGSAPANAIPGTRVHLEHRGSVRGPGSEFGTSTITVRPGTKKITFYCQVTLGDRVDWCKWTPYSSAGCPWFIAQEIRVVWYGDHWQIGPTFENESKEDNREYQAFAVIE